MRRIWVSRSVEQQVTKSQLAPAGRPSVPRAGGPGPAPRRWATDQGGGACGEGDGKRGGMPTDESWRC